ncbi:MAG TPA: hypothetical protein VEZ17_15970 [Chitinophagaceae bacterium]|nr:hypothetical protein [Chitinophagaceae bacterium]
MSTQSSGNTKALLRRPLILFLLPCFLSPNPATASENTFIQDEMLRVMYCNAQWQDKLLIDDTSQNPGSAASSSDYVEATYPGGPGAWMMHLLRTFRYPPEAFNNMIQGTVVVKFFC